MICVTWERLIRHAISTFAPSLSEFRATEFKSLVVAIEFLSQHSRKLSYLPANPVQSKLLLTYRENLIVTFQFQSINTLTDVLCAVRKV
jgi:hypothetical protein